MFRLLKKLPSNGVIRRRWMSNTTTVMSFGDGTHGALGLPASITGIGSDAYEPTAISSLPPDVCSIAAGHYHSLAVTSQGHLWSWGRNVEGQLGRGVGSPRETWSRPQRVEGLSSVRSAFASGVVSAAIGLDGSLWVWGKSKRGQLGLGNGITEAVFPSRIEALAKEEIIKDGKLFGWGYSADGRLGTRGGTTRASSLDSNGNMSTIADQTSSSKVEAAAKVVLEAMDKENDMPIVWEPCLIEELEGDGILLSGGSNTYGQLGRSKQDLGLLPVDTKERAVCVASGLGHSLAICKIPKAGGMTEGILSWGWNQNSQLGRVGPENLPNLVVGLLGEKLLSVSGGRVHSLALTSAREVFVWGCGRNGRLGLGSSIDEPEPMLVELPEGVEVLQAVSGSYDT
ncbi:Regulator of chromosome condensation 1/beta-lactamase-inhibitor protein II [Cynara cardunculus var. scolymus]|uniref:Regulator of chromosome condensation 1/beta-lactamase-inhibitor protein II n=1 Tax=Cynara cardunculus var. scolymus TaxID=59895 RepID=A0A118K195_CYNCS|nr:Regulator of chromosome condensation 1/beta-lactamase-inhibitor protein II [Cynara cardunculus var. scolymus]